MIIEALFLGGPRDGEWVVLRNPPTTIHVPVLEQFDLLVGPEPEVIAPTRYRVHSYHWHRAGSHMLYVSEDLGPREVTDLLIEGYHRP